jgi:signal transduction histidine kinase
MPVTTASQPTLGVPQRPLRRSATDAVLGGVCAGLAIRLGLRERTIRVLFSVGVLFGGLGLLVYVGLWLFLTRSGEERSIGERLKLRRRDIPTRFLLFGAIVVLVIALVSAERFGIAGLAWTGLLGALGMVAIWRGSSPDEQSRLRALVNAAPVVGATSVRGWRALFFRVVPGVVLVVVGLHVLNRVGGVWGAAVPALVGAMVLVVGLLVLLAPWWLQTVRDLTNERRERVRIEEKATMVAHIHDSVLQTLTLIERAAGNEEQVVRLARAQERELRQWLFNLDPVEGTPSSASFAALAGRIEADVESDYGVKVELVIVGDCDTDDRVLALLGAAREAAVNSAKWSGAPVVSIYGEVERETISLFVRDVGRGFDTQAVASDRQGIVLSIKGRMSQAGGRASIRSTPGSGTEVHLELPRRSS